jgi:hypothetical protein
MKHHGAPDEVKRLMLMPPIEVVQPIEGGLLWLPTFERLQPLNHCLCRDGRSLYLSVFPEGGVWVFLSDMADGESGMSVPGLAVCDDELPDDMVEDRSHVVDNLTDQNTQSDGRFSLKEAPNNHAVSASGSIRVWLTDESIGIQLQEGGNFPLDVLDLLCGPFGLSPSTIERMRQ